MPEDEETVDWLSLTIAVGPTTTEPISNRLFELGVHGVTDQGEWLIAHFPAQDRESIESGLKTYLSSLKEMEPGTSESFEISRVAETDWQNSWKKFFEAQPLGEKFFLVPKWEMGAPVPSGREPLILEPGQAFGTGLHESTQLVLELMESFASERTGEIHCLDVGTGTGILMMVARKLGFSCEGIDIDPIAVQVTEENFALNGLEPPKVSTTPLAEISDSFDLVLSNILLNTHLELAEHYVRTLRPDGRLVLAGLLVPQREDITKKLQSIGLDVCEDRTRGEWLGLTAKRAA